MKGPSMGLIVFVLLFTGNVAILTQEVGEQHCSTDPGHAAPYYYNTAPDHVLLQKEVRLTTQFSALEARTSSDKIKGKETQAQVSTLKAQVSSDSSSKSAPEFQELQGQACQQGSADPEPDPTKLTGNEATLDKCEEKCMELGENCAGFNVPTGNQKKCWFRSRIATKETTSKRICYVKVVTEETTQTKEGAATPATAATLTTPPTGAEEGGETTGVTLPYGHIVALHNVGSDAFLRLNQDDWGSYPHAAWRIPGEGNLNMTGFSKSLYGGVPHYISRFYVAHAPEGKVALWATYAGKWMHAGSIRSTFGWAGWLSRQGDVQEVFEAPKSDYYLQVIPTSDGNVRLKTEHDSYILAEEHHHISTMHAKKSSRGYNENRTKWTVIDLGKLDLPIPKSSQRQCGSRREPKVCFLAGPKKPKFKILG